MVNPPDKYNMYSPNSNLYSPNNRALKRKQQKLTNKMGSGKSTTILGYFNNVQTLIQKAIKKSSCI